MNDHPLMKSGDLQGASLVGRAGAKLGAVREVYLDLETGAVRFALVEAGGGGLLGGRGGKYHPIPWEMLRYDGAAKVFICGIDKDALKAAPSYDNDQLASPSYGWSEQVERYFTGAPVPPPEAEERRGFRH